MTYTTLDIEQLANPGESVEIYYQLEFSLPEPDVVVPRISRLVMKLDAEGRVFRQIRMGEEEDPEGLDRVGCDARRPVCEIIDYPQDHPSVDDVLRGCPGQVFASLKAAQSAGRIVLLKAIAELRID